MNKRYWILLLLPLFIFGACHKDEVTDMSFTINILYLRSTYVYYDVYPQYDGNKFTTFLVTSEQLNRQGVRAIIDSVHASITKDQIYSKGVRLKKENLLPGMRYYICCYQLNKKGNPIYTLIKQPIDLPGIIEHDLTFNITAEGSKVIVTPSNRDDSYFWDFASKSEIKINFMNDPVIYYEDMLSYYQLYEMIQYVVTRGQDDDDVDTYYNLRTNDTICLMAGFYDIPSSYSAPPEVYYLVYNDQSTFDIIKK